MVEISEIMEEEKDPQPTSNAADSRSQERLLDADEIEASLSHITRPSARLHIENLITKLRKEGKALQRVAASKSAAATASTADNDEPSATSPTKDPTQSIPKRTPATTPIITTNKYQSFPTYYFDAGQYNSPTVSVYVPLESIGTHDKSKVTCTFTPSSFDLIVSDYDGKNYRLINDNLEKDIDVDKSKYIIKANKIIIKLGKIKGEYGSYDSWQQLTAKKVKKRDASGKSIEDTNPAAGLMDMMKDMYDSGDDNMKKMIGETM